MVATRLPARAAGADLGEILTFWAWVGVVLAFSQCWEMYLTGAGPAPIAESVSASVRVFFFPIYTVILGLTLMRLGGVGKALLHSPALVLMLVVTIGSIFWSIDPQVTARRCIAVGFTTLAGISLAERFAWPRLLEVVGAAFGITVLISIFNVVLIPRLGIMQFDFPGAWRGAWTHKNMLGYYMSVAFIVFVAAAAANPQRRRLWSIAAAAAVALILLSDSKTSLVSCLIGAGCMVLMSASRRGPAWAVAGTYLLGSALLGVTLTMLVAPNLLFGLIGKDATFTGRTEIWSAVMRQIALRPMLGYGYGAVWDNHSIWGPLPWISKQQGFVVHEAHNSWLGVWLELGYVGLIAWTLLFAAVWARALPTLYVRGATYFALPFLVVFSLHSVTEAIALSQNDLVWMLIATVAVKLAAPALERRQPTSKGTSPVR